MKRRTVFLGPSPNPKPLFHYQLRRTCALELSNMRVLNFYLVFLVLDMTLRNLSTWRWVFWMWRLESCIFVTNGVPYNLCTAVFSQLSTFTAVTYFISSCEQVQYSVKVWLLPQSFPSLFLSPLFLSPSTRRFLGRKLFATTSETLLWSGSFGASGKSSTCWLLLGDIVISSA